MNIKMHTGCPCRYCRAGRDKKVRQSFHRKVRKLQKRQLKRFGEVIDPTISIGYTD